MQTCRRRFERETVTLAGSAYGVGRSRSIIVTDLSPEGAQLAGRDLPGPGQDIFVIVGPFDNLATVIWRTDDKCGIEFDGAVTDETLGRMKSEAKWMSVAGWYR